MDFESKEPAKVPKTTSESENKVNNRYLIISEYLHRLKKEDPLKVLPFILKEVREEIPPVEINTDNKNIIFSPEDEIIKLRRLGKEERKKALLKFKENLVRQREAWAMCRIFIERVLLYNQDIAKEKLMKIVEEFRRYYLFTDKQVQLVEKILDRYYKARQQARILYEKFKNDPIELVRQITGLKLDRDVNVYFSLMSLWIETNAFNAGRLFEQSLEPIRYNKLPSAGFASRTEDENPVYYIVINNEEVNLFESSGIVLSYHELEHIKNMFFMAIFEAPPPELQSFNDYINEQDQEKKEIILQDIFSMHREYALERAKDEILAYFRQFSLLKDTITYEDTKWILNNFLDNNQNPYYDYLSDLRDNPKFKEDNLYQNLAKKMLVDEYVDIIKKALDAAVKLSREGHYLYEQCIALLADRPLVTWQKTVRRLLEQKFKRSLDHS
ncbi:MAG: hypothetical protein KatS3mg097_612 [Candidatus Parcubacteria bacterium]|nr:MAG: hypothetical protein KatS3mg097_612 [Candidatus Parcubacteria bacterium]